MLHPSSIVYNPKKYRFALAYSNKMSAFNTKLADVCEDELFTLTNLTRSSSPTNDTYFGGGSEYTPTEWFPVESDYHLPSVEPFNEFSDPNIRLTEKPQIFSYDHFMPTIDDSMTAFKNYELGLETYSVNRHDIEIPDAEDLEDYGSEDDDDDEYEVGDEDATMFLEDTRTPASSVEPVLEFSPFKRFGLFGSAIEDDDEEMIEEKQPVARSQLFVEGSSAGSFQKSLGKSLKTIQKMAKHKHSHLMSLVKHEGSEEAGTSNQCMLINPATNQPCGKNFTRPYDLIRHQETIHASKKRIFKCVICENDYKEAVQKAAEAEPGKERTVLVPKTFSRKDALSRHIRVKHELAGQVANDAMKYAVEHLELVPINSVH